MTARASEYFTQWLAPPAAAEGDYFHQATAKPSSPTQVAFTAIPLRSRLLATSRPAFGNLTINLYSDLLVHHMGPGLADGLAQGKPARMNSARRRCGGLGSACGSCTMAAPTTSSPRSKITTASGNSTYPASEANQSVTNFNGLSSTNQQDLVDFLRSL